MNQKDFFSLKNLKRISGQNVKFFTATGIDKMNYGVYKKQEKTILAKMSEKIVNNSYEFTKYKEKLLVKDRYSLPRCISVPTLADRVCLKAIHELLMHKFKEAKRIPLPQEAIKNIDLNNQEYDYYIKIDISDFFGSINHYRLFTILKEKIAEEHYLRLIKNALETKTDDRRLDLMDTRNTMGVQQGLSISNILAHIYLLDFDMKYENVKNMSYTRYVDDILILCRYSDKNEIIESLSYNLQRYYMLSLNSKKSESGFIKASSFNYLGYHIKHINGTSNPLLSIPKNKVVSIQDRIMAKITKYKKTKGDPNFPTAKELFIFELNLIITGAITSKLGKDTDESRRYGWVFYYSQLTDLTVLYQLDAFIRRQIKNSFSINEQKEMTKRIKTFSRSYYETKYNFANSKYFERPDEMGTKEQIFFLKKVYNRNISTDMSAEDVSDIFYKHFYARIKEESEDIIRGNS